MPSELFDPPSPPQTLWSLEFIDAVARHREIAQMLDDAPCILETARTNAERWLASGNCDESESASVQEWLPLLSNDRLNKLRDVLTSCTENPIRMRHSSPFTGIIAKATYRSLRDNFIKEWSRHAP